MRSINDGWRLDSRSQKPDPTTQTPYQLTLPNFGGFPRVFPLPQLRKPHPKWFDENIWNFYRVQIYAELLMSSPLRWPQKNDDDAVVTLKYEGTLPSCSLVIYHPALLWSRLSPLSHQRKDFLFLTVYMAGGDKNFLSLFLLWHLILINIGHALKICNKWLWNWLNAGVLLLLYTS